MTFAIFLKSSLQFPLSFLFINKTLQLNNLKTRTGMNAKMSVFVVCVEAIIYLLLFNLHARTFNDPDDQTFQPDLLRNPDKNSRVNV